MKSCVGCRWCGYGVLDSVQRATGGVYYISPKGEYATWRATRQSSGYDIKTFEVRARPVQKVDGLRPGMSVLVDRAAISAVASRN